MRFQFTLIFLAVGAMFLPGCGGSGELPAPPKGAKRQAWADDGMAITGSGKAAFRVKFEDINGAIAAASEIYMNVKDPYGRGAYAATEKADAGGAVSFQDVPVGNYLLEFRDSGGRMTRLRIDLDDFTGANAGKDAGTAQF